MDLTELWPRLANLRRLLAADDLQAAKAFEELRSSLYSAFGPRTNPLEAHVRAYAFDEALQTLDAMIQGLENT